MNGRFTFPKPLVFLGFALILAAVAAGIYKSATQKSEGPAASPDKKALAEKVIVAMFENLKEELKKSGEVKVEDFDAFVKVHKDSYVTKYVIINDELSTGKYSKEEALKKDQEFHTSSINSLKKIYSRKYFTRD